MKKLQLLLISLLFFNYSFSQNENIPQIKSEDNQIVFHKNYTLSYNESCEQANWVKYMVTESQLESNSRRKNNFKSDNLVITESASTSDYKGSGYDRGHLASAKSFSYSQESIDETFFMSNMSPQEPSFNRGIWKKLENYERNMAEKMDTVYVITGGILSGDLKTIGDNEVCVPEEFYKIIYNKKYDFIECFLMKNEKSNESIDKFKISLEALEEVSGFDFMIK